MEKNYIILLIILILVSLDRIVKVFISKIKFPILKIVHNKGVVFGLFNNNIKFLSILFSIVLIIILILILFKTKNKDGLKIVGLSLIISGLISNLIDRILYSYVIDYIDFIIWPVFNLADIYVVVGVILIIVSLFKIRK